MNLLQQDANYFEAALIAADMINNGCFPGVLPNKTLVLDSRFHFFSAAVSPISCLSFNSVVLTCLGWC